MANAAIQSGTLTATTVKTVTLDRAYARVDVLNRDTANTEIWFTVDGTVPSVGGDNCYCLIGRSSLQVRLHAPLFNNDGSSAAATVVKLISSGTPNYSVMGIDAFETSRSM